MLLGMDPLDARLCYQALASRDSRFDGRVFVFRTVCGLVFTVIYATRGFAPAVWTHVTYDIWVLVMAP